MDSCRAYGGNDAIAACMRASRQRHTHHLQPYRVQSPQKKNPMSELNADIKNQIMKELRAVELRTKD
ncbi:MAG: hypothetical protein IKA00_09265 [Prevotella sp.]|nr:hypothetical protein [Prevotella sp.]